jgi:hypothetical protein
MSERAKALAVLGLTPHATPAEIRRHWRTLVKKYHPDTIPSTISNSNPSTSSTPSSLSSPCPHAAAQRRFQELAAAYDLIKQTNRTVSSSQTAWANVAQHHAASWEGAGNPRTGRMRGPYAYGPGGFRDTPGRGGTYLIKWGLFLLIPLGLSAWRISSMDLSTEAGRVGGVLEPVVLDRLIAPQLSPSSDPSDRRESRPATKTKRDGG